MKKVIDKSLYDRLFEIDSDILSTNEQIESGQIRLRKLRQDRQIAYDTLRDNRKP